MAGVERVTVTLPNDLLREINRRARNRSKFVGMPYAGNSTSACVRSSGVPWRTHIAKP
jgi:hypothetical protein